jgi:monoamine oxidase
LLEDEQFVLNESIESLAHIFGIQRKDVEELLEEAYTHNWRSDPFSRGAYSYVPVGALEAQTQLAESVDDTLFFAGEAANTEGHSGTVHGAIQSGMQAAREITGDRPLS